MVKVTMHQEVAMLKAVAMLKVVPVMVVDIKVDISKVDITIFQDRDIITIFQDRVIKEVVEEEDHMVEEVDMEVVALAAQRQMHWVFMVMNVLIHVLNNNYITLVMDKLLVLTSINMMIFLLKKVQVALNLITNSLKKLSALSFYIIFT
jgi:hypothetical protein